MKNRKSRLVAVLTCCIMLFALAACTAEPGAPAAPGHVPVAPGAPGQAPAAPGQAPAAPGQAAPAGRDTLTIAVAHDSGTLDPLGISGLFMTVPTAYMEPLWDFNPDREKVWILATGLDMVTPTQWHIHIRQGVQFSNGNPLTAHDVLFTLRLWADTPARALNVVNMDLENSRVLDDYTLELMLTRYDFAIPFRLSTTLIANEASYDPVDFSLNPIGTGPFIVTDYVVNSHVDMTVNENWWGGRPAIENLRFLVLNEDAQRVNAIQTGMVDISAVPPQDIEFVMGLPGFNVELIPSGENTIVKFNTTEYSIFDNVYARRAVAHAINRQAIVNLVYSGFAAVTTSPVSSANIDFEDRFANIDETYSIGFNVDLARQYAERAGLVGQEVSILTNGSPAFVTMAEIMQANLRDIGVDVVILNFDQATLRSLFRTDPTAFDMVVTSVAAPTLKALSNMIGNVRFSEIIGSPGAWEGLERYMELVAIAESTPDERLRSDSLLEMFQLFNPQVPWYGVADLTNAQAFSTDLGTIEFWGTGTVRFHLLYFAQ